MDSSVQYDSFTFFGLTYLVNQTKQHQQKQIHEANTSQATELKVFSMMAFYLFAKYKAFFSVLTEANQQVHQIIGDLNRRATVQPLIAATTIQS